MNFLPGPTLHRLVLPGVMLFAASCASAPKTAEAPRPAPQTPAAPVYTLDQIEGASAQRLDGLLGEPSLTRREGDGEYRRYALTSCTLIVILYPDEIGNSKVAHVDATATTSSTQKPDLADCLAAG